MLGIKASATTNQTVAKEDVHDNDIKKAEELAIERNAALEKENAVVKKDVYDNDIRNAELVMDAHSVDPFEIMRIQQYDDVPMAKAGDDIVVRVEVSLQNTSQIVSKRKWLFFLTDIFSRLLL